MAEAPRPAFYALGGGRGRDLLTLLHPPYTAWHLSYVALGAAVAPHVRVGRLLWTLAAFTLAVGIAAHALDELNGRPLGTRIAAPVLKALAVTGLAAALAIGVAGAVTVTPWLAVLVVAGGLIVPAYNLELLGGRAHGDAVFALAWGAFPAFTGYFAQAERVALPGLLVSAGCTGLSVAQRRLSTRARELRRRTRSVSGEREASDGTCEQLTVATLLAPIDGALAALSLAMVALAAGLLAARL